MRQAGAKSISHHRRSHHRQQSTIAVVMSMSSTISSDPEELFTYSPFGLRCQLCKPNFSIQLDERCISRHLKKHGMDNRVATVKSLFETFKSQIESAKASRDINPFRSDDIFYAGYSCICGQVFQIRKDSAVRHCRKMGCDASRLKNVELIKLCCGRYVSDAQVKSVFSPPRITKQFNYTEARAALLP
jgi:hypothetical protein